jgi:hypothetical protein
LVVVRLALARGRSAGPDPMADGQVGHAKPDTLLRIYAQVMQGDRA